MSRHADFVLRQLRCGAVVRFVADGSTLDNAAVARRDKYGVILRHAGDTCWFLFTTSQQAYFQAHPHVLRDTLVIPSGFYPWVTRDTYVYAKDAKKLGVLDQMVPLHARAQLSFMTPLHDNHRDELVEKVRASLQLSASMKRILLDA